MPTKIKIFFYSLFQLVLIFLTFITFSMVITIEPLSYKICVMLLSIGFLVPWYRLRLKKKSLKVKISESDSNQDNDYFQNEIINFSEEEIEKVPQGFNPSAYLNLERLIIKNPSLQLQKEEVCFYEGNAYAYKDKERVTGYSGGGAGVSYRIAKGISIHTGSSAKKAIRETVRDSYKGTLFITNHRVVLLAPKYGFAVQIPQLAQILHSGRSIQLYKQNGTAYSFVPEKYNSVMKVLTLMSNLHQDDQQ